MKPSSVQRDFFTVSFTDVVVGNINIANMNIVSSVRGETTIKYLTGHH